MVYVVTVTPSWAVTATVIVLLPIFILNDDEAVPVAVTTLLTRMVEVESLAVGVTVTEVTELRIVTLYEVVAVANDKEPLEISKLLKVETAPIYSILYQLYIKLFNKYFKQLKLKTNNN